MTIVVQLGSGKVGFDGHWLVSPDEPFEWREKRYAVGLTDKGKLVVYVTYNHDIAAEFDVYDAFDQLEDWRLPPELRDEIAERLEVPTVRHLDI